MKILLIIFLFLDLAGLARVAARQGQLLRAPRLLGAVEHMGENLSYALEVIERSEFEREVAFVRQALTAEEFSRA